MADDVTKPQTLEERITARIRESIGELMTDADLRGIVERGVEQALFHPRLERRNTYGPDVYAPALIHQLVEKQLGEQMRAAVDAWLAENPERVEAAVTQAIQAGVADALIQTMDRRFGDVFRYGVEQLRASGALPSVAP